MSELCNWEATLYMVNGSSSAIPDNITLHRPTQYVYLVLYPFLLCSCTIGNFLIIAALLKDSVKTSSVVYLIALACGDLCVLWSILPDYIFIASSDLGTLNENSTFLTHFVNYKGFSVFWNETAVQFSDWTLIIFSIERLVVSLRPLSVHTRSTSAGIRKAVIMEFFILFLAILFSLCYLVTYYYYYTLDAEVQSRFSLQDALTNVAPALSRWYTLESDAEMGMWIAKWILLTILDIAIIITLWKHWRSMQRHQQGQGGTVPSDSCASARKPRNATIIVLGSLTLYTITQLPYVVFNCLRIASRPPYCSYNLTPDAITKATPVLNVINWTNYSVSFLVYCLASSKFRKQLGSLYRHVPQTSSLAAKRFSASTEVISLEQTRSVSQERLNRIMK